MKKAAKIVIVNVLVFLILFAVMEGGSRLLFPEFIGEIHSELFTRGIRQHFAEFKGFS